MTLLLPLEIPVHGALDTENPRASRPPGTLLEAKDLAHRWWGPRRGHKMVTWPREGNATAHKRGAGRALIDFAAGIFATGPIKLTGDGLRDEYTLDIVLRLLASPSGVQEIFQWRNGSGRDLVVKTDTNDPWTKIQVFFLGSGGAVHLESTTGLTYEASGDDHIFHSRVVRLNATTAKLYINGVLEDTNTSLATSVDNLTRAQAVWYLAGTSGTLVGNIYRAFLRKTVCDDFAGGFMDGLNPRASDVLLAVAGSSDNGLSVVRDYSSYGAHGLLVGSPSTASRGGAPFVLPVQGMRSFRDRDGESLDVVMVGGSLEVRTK